MNTYIANNIEVLILSRTADSVGMVIPPEAYVKMPDNITVSYGEDDNEVKAGTATLRREGNIIYADMILKSPMKDIKKAQKLLSKLYPAVAFFIQDYHENTVLKLEISEVFLTTYPNDSKKIKKLGNKISLIPSKKDLH